MCINTGHSFNMYIFSQYYIVIVYLNKTVEFVRWKFEFEKDSCSSDEIKRIFLLSYSRLQGLATMQTTGGWRGRLMTATVSQSPKTTSGKVARDRWVRSKVYLRGCWSSSWVTWCLHLSTDVLQSCIVATLYINATLKTYRWPNLPCTCQERGSRLPSVSLFSALLFSLCI